MKSHRHVLVKKISEPTDIQTCLAIRHQVFVEGQNVPLHEEVDGLDSSSEHYLLFLNKLPDVIVWTPPPIERLLFEPE